LPRIFELIFFLTVAVIVISVLRSVIGVLLKILRRVLGGPVSNAAQGPQRPVIPTGGELKKDPVCGTFISTSGSLQKKVGGEVYYFCSVECRDKFKG
jgi:YHS domain-containing protein